MPNLLIMCFEGELSPSFDMRCLSPGKTLPDGWGMGYYPGGEPSVSVFKEPAPTVGSVRAEIVKAWERVASSVFALHIRSATWGTISDANTQPFVRSWGRRDWMFVHSGSLDARPDPGPDPRFEPVGSTDTEALFCVLLNRIAREGWRTLREVSPQKLQEWLSEFDARGVLTCALTDGSDVVFYADREGQQPAYVGHVKPPYSQVVFGDEQLQVNLTRRGAKPRKGVLLASSPLPSEAGSEVAWKPLSPGSLLVVRQGEVVTSLAPLARSNAGPSLTTLPARAVPKRPQTAPKRCLEIIHQTSYRYARPVERSTHLLRLEPYHDRLQRLDTHRLDVSVDGLWRNYDDVFGNRVRRLVVETPFQEMTLRAHSRVQTLDTDPLELRPLHARTTIPLNWMPWQRHMLQPYLLPPELPDTQLTELHEYAMSFVERNGYDLVDSLLDMNQSIFRDYAYKQGSTTVFTTAFECYVKRQGVCQDFTNLFICLARLLGIPARYVCGYLYTGPKHANRAMAEATHAWAQVYLPDLGWKGFDPTNGVLTQTDHVRVAVGRNYLDATPTSGTLFVGGGAETLEVSVTVEEVGG